MKSIKTKLEFLPICLEFNLYIYQLLRKQLTTFYHLSGLCVVLVEQPTRLGHEFSSFILNLGLIL